jgi:hypothetical protein
MVWRKSLSRPTLWESGLPAIWRAAAAIQATRFFLQKRASRFTTAAQPIATKVCSHRVGCAGDSMVWRKSLRRLDPLWESGLPAIWRAAAAIQATRFFRQKRASRFTTAAQPIATKVCSRRVN